MTKSERGIFSEWRVANDRVRSFEERLLWHREKTPYAEIDLLFGTSAASGRTGLLTLVEVKSWNFEIWRSELVSRRQIARLERARFFLQEKYRTPVRLLLAVVAERAGRGTEASVGKTEIRYFEDLAGY